MRLPIATTAAPSPRGPPIVPTPRRRRRRMPPSRFRHAAAVRSAQMADPGRTRAAPVERATMTMRRRSTVGLARASAASRLIAMSAAEPLQPPWSPPSRHHHVTRARHPSRSGGYGADLPPPPPRAPPRRRVG